MTVVDIQPATQLDAVLAYSMRPADAAEVKASGGYSPWDAVQDALAFSTHSWAVRFNGELGALFGVGPVQEPEKTPVEGVGVAWLLTSTVVNRHLLAFAKASRTGVRMLLELYPVLSNAIDQRYEDAQRWAEWLGFQLGEPTPFGMSGKPFLPIIGHKDTMLQKRKRRTKVPTQGGAPSVSP